MPVKNRIQLRRGTTQQWNETIDILGDGEVGFDIDQYNLKIGDGESAWAELPWLVNFSGQIVSTSGIFDVIEFNTEPGVFPTNGQIAWDDTYGTLTVGLQGDHVLHLGQETHFRVRNTTGSTLYKGQPVAATGIHSDNIRLLVDKYVADASLREVRFIGLISEDIDNNQSGYSTNFGYIRGNINSPLDTRGNVVSPIAVGDETWAQGDILYVHPTAPGKLTNVEPKHSIIVAIIVSVHQNQGIILTRPTSYGHLSDNHDVNVSGATNGQFLQYNSSTDYWVPSSSGNFTNLTINNNQIVTGQGSSNHIAYWNSSSGISYDNGQLYWDSSSNELGIGTNNPVRNIDVVSSAGTSVGIKLNSTGTGGRSYSFFSTNNGSSLGGGKFGMYDDTAQAARLVIDSNGNVGIGTTTPSGTLHVIGNAYVDNIKIDNNTISTANTNGDLIFEPNGNGDLVLLNTNSLGSIRCSGGNSRGVNAVDFQIFRVAGTEVAAGDTSFLAGGLGNTITAIGTSSFIGAGESNTINSPYSAVFGYYNSTSGDFSFIAGLNNTVNHNNTHVFGSGITTTQANTTYTENIVSNGNVSIDGHLSASTKSFLIKHPTKENHKLQYGSLESPYHGVRLTGRAKTSKGKCVVDLPEYIRELVRDDENVNIQITNYKHSKTLYVDDINIKKNNFTVKVGRTRKGEELEFFWSFTAVRKDVEELKVEF